MFDPTDRSSPSYYPPPSTALLLLDFHSLFVSHAGGPMAVAAAQNAASLRLWAHSKGIHIIHGLVDITKRAAPTTKDRARFDAIIASMEGTKDGEESEIVTTTLPSIPGGGPDVTFKRTPGIVSALNSPGINEYLEKNGIKSLLITGLSTSGCVLRTALPATDAGYVVTIISDAVADKDEELHKMVLAKLLSNRSYVMTSEEFKAGYEWPESVQVKT